MRYVPHLMKKADMVVGLDLSIDRLRATKKICPYIVHGSALKLPFRNKVFDAIWASEIIEHMGSFRVFDEIERVSKKLIATIPNLIGPMLFVNLDDILNIRCVKFMLMKFLSRRQWTYKFEGLGLCLPLPLNKHIRNVFKHIKSVFFGLSRLHMDLAFTLLIIGGKIRKDSND